MPSLNGSVGYIFSSCDLDTKNSGNVRIKEMIERFKVYDQPRRPEGKEQEFLAGENVTPRGTLSTSSAGGFRVHDTCIQTTLCMADSTYRRAGWMRYTLLV